ncbi:MAG TPA: AAA family ATPase [bacterium]
MAKVRLFVELHKIKMLIVAGLLLAVFWPVFTITRLDSYQQTYLWAIFSMAPIQSAIYGGIFVAMLFWLHYGGGSASRLAKSEVAGEKINVKWSEVIGLDEAKEEAGEVVELLKDHAKVSAIGGKVLRGILLCGPPGCGKTYLAKAIATESKLPFLSMSGSEFIEIFVGTGPARVRRIFKKAQLMARIHGGCIIFIDELDAVGTSRGTDLGFGAQTERNNTVNELLVQLDGLESARYNIVVMGATNASEDVLDQALLRPGRFDRKIYIDRPGLEDREKLFQFYFSRVKVDPAINIGRLARRSVWKTPAEIQNIIQEAALIATRNKRSAIAFKDISEAFERVDMGSRRYKKMTDEERKDTAYHEAGHLITLYLLHPTDDVFKASIYMRRSSLGVVYHAPRFDYFSHKRDKLLADIKVSLAGFVAEKLKCSSTTTGVTADFRHAMGNAHAMVWQFGMGSNGFIGDYELLTGSWAFRKGAAGDHLSDNMKDKLNNETHDILNRCLKDVEDLLRNEDALLERFKDELLSKNELEFDEIEAIFVEHGKQRLFPSEKPSS